MNFLEELSDHLESKKPTEMLRSLSSIARRYPVRPVPNISASAYQGTRRSVTTKDSTLPCSPDGGNSAQNSVQIPGIHKTGGRKLAIVFTCTKCETRAAKQFSEQSYQNGVVIVRCPGCESLHLIADRIGYFEGGRGPGFDLETELKDGGNFRRVTNDDVFELTVEDVAGRAKTSLEKDAK